MLVTDRMVLQTSFMLKVILYHGSVRENLQTCHSHLNRDVTLEAAAL